MSTRLTTLFVLFPLLLGCNEQNVITPPDNSHKQAVVEDTPTTPETPPEQEDTTTTPVTPPNTDPEPPVEVPEDAILVTNPSMEAYLEEVNYPEGDWSYSKILDYPDGGFEGKGDLPPTITLTWPTG